MKSNRVNLPYKLFSQGNPPQDISKSLLVSSCNAEFDHVDSSSGSIPHLFIYPPRNHPHNARSDIRDLTHLRRRRQGRRLVKNVFLFYFVIFCNFLKLSIVSVGVKTCLC